MARRFVLLVLLSLGAPLYAQPPAEWFTRPILPEATRRGQMYGFVNANIPALPEFRTLDDWRQHKAALKPRLLRLIGLDDALLQRPLRVEHHGVLEREGYTIEKIVYETYPGMFVPAVVWVPKGLKGKAPAVVSISGHNYCDSKAADSVQAIDFNLVRRGFIVVSYDYLGCFERARLDPCQKGVFGGEDHTNSLFSYTGHTPTGIEVLDGIRAVDYLYSRSDVDRTRIAFTGASGGGNSTYWVSALDERITLAVSVSAAGAFSQWIKVDNNYDWHQRPPGLRAFADIGTFYALIAPRPLLVINGHPELVEFALPDALRSVDYARHIYALYGQPNAVAFHESSTGHGYQEDKRVQLYTWLNRWFFRGAMPFGEAEQRYQAEPRDTLRVGLPGDNLTIPTLARRWVEECPAPAPAPDAAKDAPAWRQAARRRLEELLARRDPRSAPGVIYRYDYQVSSAPYRAEHLQFEVAPDLILPAVFVRREGTAAAKTIIVLGKARGASEEARALLDRGYALLCLDPRGTGEVDWGGGRTTNWANFVGRPPVGMWAEDISKAATYLLARPDVSSVAVLGDGVFGKAALYATALDDRLAVAAVTLDTASYRREATSGLAHVYADVPRILTWGDTPELAALVAPRPLAILGAGKPVSLNNEQPTYFSPGPRFGDIKERVPADELRTVFDPTSRFYELMKASDRFEATDDPSKHAEGVVAWFTRHF